MTQQINEFLVKIKQEKPSLINEIIDKLYITSSKATLF